MARISASVYICWLVVPLSIYLYYGGSNSIVEGCGRLLHSCSLSFVMVRGAAHRDELSIATSQTTHQTSFPIPKIPSWRARWSLMICLGCWICVPNIHRNGILWRLSPKLPTSCDNCLPAKAPWWSPSWHLFLHFYLHHWGGVSNGSY